jgi:hypothetical protein
VAANWVREAFKRASVTEVLLITVVRDKKD